MGPWGRAGTRGARCGAGTTASGSLHASSATSVLPGTLLPPPRRRAAVGWSTRRGHPLLSRNGLQGAARCGKKQGQRPKKQTCCGTIHGAVSPRRVRREGVSTSPRPHPPTRRARTHLRAQSWARRKHFRGGAVLTPRVHPIFLPHGHTPVTPNRSHLMSPQPPSAAPHPSAAPVHVDPPPSTKPATQAAAQKLLIKWL